MEGMIQQEAALNILRAADLILQDGAATLKPFDLTVAQFNVLRILRGAPEGLPSGQIGQRMINRDPDITRLLDRMEHHQLIFRQRSDHDRRVVTARITQNGLDLLKRADPIIAASHHRQFAGFTEKQLQQIIQLMTQMTQQNELATLSD